MPKMTTKPSALPISGLVTARSEFGIKIEGIEDWLNWSKEEYRKEPWEADDVQKGDWVDLEVSGKYIKSICLVEPPTTEPMVKADHDRNEAEQREDPFEGIETLPDGSPALRLRNPTDREQSIQKQVALKAAVELVIGMAGPAPVGQVAGPINADYVIQIFRKFRNALNEEAE